MPRPWLSVGALLLVVNWSAAKKVSLEYLTQGEKKFYFNSCECGLLGVEEQDVTCVDGAKYYSH